ncbi:MULTISPECIES: hypothetical protein [unclassified Amycolatopsis]|uniref:hypothetical protein n=1 Tax=unclassified Amycolatopsis TaxID=2618356 RepID=UPI001C6A6347|nr:hypothetical protein [Amycolatopsis sp. DSM 110486]QYN21232.1 hypothetical protein K1T34_01245 [Amycolatopsis sp. DSM 110486]
MPRSLESLSPADGEQVAKKNLVAALTAGRIVYDDGAEQVFDHDGATTYTDRGHPTRGEWYIDADGRFASFWPPTYRASYDLRWVVEAGSIVGLSFTHCGDGSQFTGRYA